MRAPIGIGIVALTASTAHADPATANRLYAEGQRAYQAENFDVAAAKFTAAYTQDPDPVYLFNAAQAYRFGNDCVRSAAMYRDFLAKVPNPPNADKIKVWYEEASTCAKLRARTATPATPDPTTSPSEPEPIVVQPPREPSRASPGKGKKIAAIVAGGVGLVAIGLGAKFTLDVGQAETDRANVCPAPCEWDAPSSTDIGDTQRVADINARGERAQQLAITSFAIGGLALAGGVALYLWSRQDAEQPIAIGVAPATGGGVVVGGFSF